MSINSGSKTNMRVERACDFIILLVMAVFVAWYLNDAYQASKHIMNLILVAPLSILVLLLCTIQFVKQLRMGQTLVAKDLETEREPFASVVPVMLLFAAYVLSLPWLGFDVGTFAFISIFLWVHGEKRWVWALAYGIAFAALVSFFFSKMLPYPMPMLIFPTAY